MKLVMPKQTAAEIIAENLDRARVFGVDGAAERLESVPHMSSFELLDIATGQKYSALGRAATAELGARLAFIDSVYFAAREENASE